MYKDSSGIYTYVLMYTLGEEYTVDCRRLQTSFYTIYSTSSYPLQELRIYVVILVSDFPFSNGYRCALLFVLIEVYYIFPRLIKCLH